MRNLLLIAKREYLERVRTRAFAIATVLIPLVMVGAILLSTRGTKSAGHIAIVSSDSALALDLQEELEKSDSSEMLVDVEQPTPGWQQRLNTAVGKKDIDGYLLIDSSTPDPVITYSSGSKGDISTKSTLNNALRRVLARERLLHRGMRRNDIDALLKTPVLQTATVSNGHVSSSNTTTGFYAAYALFFLMYFVVMMHGINVASSVVEEKSSRVFEVMLATVKPSDMMGGKLLGVGAVGLTQVGIWVLCIAALLFTPALALMGAGDFKLQLSGFQLVAFVVFFILGFMLYSSIAAAVGALVSSEQELRQFNMVIALPMAVNTFVLAPVILAPNSLLSTILSFIPTSTPLLMFLRLSIADVPLWQVGLSIVTLSLSICAVVWFAARIYRVGILMYGKRPTLPEILRWVRYS
ncbi:ABC transporter permease [Terriglobus saanensis]|uniref:Putative transporter n=1 Tax=Terriglobus saanensis (strain ATCC BAA-1853 / DSM 23119 / SP1PR4) TaxID=401053 RepID=E8V123_TERSS|nr:ABC transporter permease [Terriglobus saanensis]ADV83371.1 putative transporter [Terriglobus saanensis SP1PR4]